MNPRNHPRTAGPLLACCFAAALPMTGQTITFPMPPVAGETVRVTGTLSDADGRPVGGLVHTIEEGPGLVLNSVMVGEDGRFAIDVRTKYGVLVHVSSADHPPEEKYIEPGTEGDIHLDFSLLRAQHLTGRIVEQCRTAVTTATVHVRYHEPDRPLRRAAFHDFHETGVNGSFRVYSVGIGVPFYIDVHAPGYVPVSSELLERKLGDVTLPDIVLRKRGGSVRVTVVDDAGVPVEDAYVAVRADPAGFEAHERGSLLHFRGFSQRGVTSRFGGAWFSGVPAGRIRIHAESSRGEARVEERIEEGQRLEITLSIDSQ